MNIKLQINEQRSMIMANSYANVTIPNSVTSIEISVFNDCEMVQTEEERKQIEEL